MVGVFAAALAATIAAVAGLAGDAVEGAGDEALAHRRVVPGAEASESGERPLAVFLGDSTFRPSHAWPRLLERRLGGRARVRIVGWEGFGPFQHYLLAHPTMELSPRAVVITAQLRVFDRREPLVFADLLTLIPPSELLRALRVPFHARAVSLPRLVLASLWGRLGGAGEAALRAFEGARLLALRLPGLDRVVPKGGAGGAQRLAFLRRERFLQYDRPIGPRHPALRALAAAVERCTRGGAEVLVVVSPIPVERLRDAGHYDAALFARRVGALADAVEGEGGALLDLHALLGPEAFHDEFGHMTEDGARRVTLAVQPWLRRALAP